MGMILVYDSGLWEVLKCCNLILGFLMLDVLTASMAAIAKQVDT